MGRARLRRALGLSLLIPPVWFLATPAPALAQPEPARIALLVLVDDVSFTDLLTWRGFEYLATLGGAGLMTTATGSHDGEDAGYRVIGAGSPLSEVRPSLLAQSLAVRGVAVCLIGSGSGATRLVTGPRTSLTAPGCPPRSAERVDPTVPGGVRTDRPAVVAAVEAARALAEGAGSRALVVIDIGDTARVDRESELSLPKAVASNLRAAVAEAHGAMGEAMTALEGTQTLVVVASPSPSRDMEREGETVTAALMAILPPQRIVPTNFGPRSLTSDTTRFDGLVANVDVAPTILDFFDLPIPEEMAGTPMRPARVGAPFDLHDRYLLQRRIRFPVQLGAAVAVAAILALAIAAMGAAMRGARPSRRMRPAVRFLVLCGIGLYLSLLLGGILDRPTYAVVVPFLGLATLALAGFSLAVRRVAGPLRLPTASGPFAPFEFLAMFGLVTLVVDLALGGPMLRAPLLGATAFDGVRFYGLPNAFLAVLLGSSVLLAQRFEPFAGAVLLVAAAMLAGLPGLGADIGGSATMWFAAGLWWVLRTRTVFRLREISFVLGSVVFGVAMILLLHRILPGAPTHIARAAADGDLVTAFVRRLGIGAGQVASAPVALLPLLALPAALVIALRPPRAIGRGLVLEPGLREAVVVVAAGSIAAYVFNDTGVAAAAPGLIYALPVLTFAALEAPTRA